MAATPAITQQPFTPSGNTRTNDAQAQADPFYQSTPRTNPSGMTTLIAAVQQVAPQPPPARQSRQLAPRAKVPACTHMTMTRMYGANACHNCGRIPAIGWLYACRQDNMHAAHDLSVSESVDSLPTVEDSGSYFEAQAQIATCIGMSASVVKQMRAGLYTYDQIETLLAQRRHVIDTIRRTKNPSTASVPPTPSPPKTRRPEGPNDIIASAGTTAVPATQNLNIKALPMSPTGTPNNTTADSHAVPATADIPQREASKSTRRNPKQEACTYQVCHNCRPFFQDRLPMSFEPALNDEVPVLAKQDMTMLPVHNAAIVSNLGLRRRLPPTPLRRSEESMDITMHQRDGNGYESFGQDTSSDWTPTTTTSSEAESFDLSPRPGPGAYPVCLATDGSAYDSGFEEGKREIDHGYGKERQGLGISGTEHPTVHIASTPENTPSKGSSVSLPIPPTTPLTGDTVSSTYSLPERSSPRSNKSSNSSRGSEVEVDGGVALTEEAVGSRRPDIRVNLPASPENSRRLEEVGNETDRINKKVGRCG